MGLPVPKNTLFVVWHPIKGIDIFGGTSATPRSYRHHQASALPKKQTDLPRTMHKAPTITTKDVLRQLKADLIGKDSYRGVTLTYSWLANQFGHFSLGFIPAILVYNLLRCWYTVSVAALWSALVVSLFWILFELYNFLGPLLLNRQSKSNLLFMAAERYTFKPAWANIAFDTATDVGFFCTGAFSASLMLYPNWPVGWVLAGLALTLAYPSSYWYRTKLFLQSARYPFQFRLSQWDAAIDKDDAETVLSFIKSQAEETHLLVFGGRQSGKTSLGVGIASECSIRHQSSIYTTGMKLYALFFEPNQTLPTAGPELWTWRDASLLVIDDINPGGSVPYDLVTPNLFLTLLNGNGGTNGENRRIIKNKRVIWVMGNKDYNTAYRDWQQMLLDIGVASENILTVNLQSSAPV